MRPVAHRRQQLRDPRFLVMLVQRDQFVLCHKRVTERYWSLYLHIKSRRQRRAPLARDRGKIFEVADWSGNQHKGGRRQS